MIDVKVFSINGCADTPATIELVKKTAKELEVEIGFSHIEISSLEDAEQYKFPGSPTVRLNGLDIEPDMRNPTHFGMG